MDQSLLDETFCWDILDTYFLKGNSAESVSPLIKHQIDSYNKFINTTLPQIISGFNPIKINTNTKNNLQAHYKRFYQNGEICISCSYINGKRVGKCYEFDENGNHINFYYMLLNYFKEVLPENYDEL